MRLLDVGCGWGSMAIHAARPSRGRGHRRGPRPRAGRRGQAPGVDAGLADQVEIRLQDYRDLRGEQFDAISSIGMFEHVGSQLMLRYFETLRALLTPAGGWSTTPSPSRAVRSWAGGPFVGRYVFPRRRAGRRSRRGRGHAAERVRGPRRRVPAGALRTDAAPLGRQPRAPLGPGRRAGRSARADIWRLYMAASANGFDDGGLAVHQVLGVVTDSDGRSGMPLTRGGWG